MAKVIIYEDCSYALSNYYSQLTRGHDVWGFLLDDPQFTLDTKEQFAERLKQLEQDGFDASQIQRGLPDIHPEADVYFLDGLYGRCFEILPHLPKDRSYVYTGSPPVLRQAQEEGYNIVWSEEEIPRIAQRHSTE